MERVDSLTGIRGFAAIWVLLFHEVRQPLAPFIDSFIAKGESAVNLFFVLSGFVMAYVYADKMNVFSLAKTRGYLWRRFARIYPVHLAVLLMLVGLMVVARMAGSPFDEENFAVGKFLYQLFMINGIGIPNSDGWNHASWTISSEFAAYFCFPFLILWTLKLSHLQSALAIVAIYALNFVLAFVVNGGESFYLPDAFILSRIATQFIVGCLIYNLASYPGLKKISPWISIVTFLAIIAVTVFCEHQMVFGFLFVLYAVLVLALAVDKRSIVNKFFCSRVMIFLGNISYSMYIAQIITGVLVMQLVRRIPILNEFSQSNAWFHPAVCLIAGIIAGALLHYFLEVPANKWLNRNGDKIYQKTFGAFRKGTS